MLFGGSGFANPILNGNTTYDTQGYSAVLLTSSSGFVESGIFHATDSQGKPLNVKGYELTGTYQGIGYIDPNTGIINFIGGSLTVYVDSSRNFGSNTGMYGADDGSSVADFLLMPGQAGALDTGGMPKGEMTVDFMATSITPGYWFYHGLDLSNVPPSWVTAISTMGSTDFYPDDGLKSLLDQSARDLLLKLPDTLSGSTIGELFLDNSGKLAIDPAPEPATLMMLAIGFLGLAVAAKNRKKLG
jgi:hypothetical protein